jgi:anti-sigma factor RsiW
MKCAEVQEQIAAYVDGEVPAAAPRIAAHLDTCAECRALAHAQTTARAVLKARAPQLSPVAPPGLRVRIAASTSAPVEPEALRWAGRLSAFAAAAIVVLTLGAVLLPVVTIRSTVVLAAQLALDHLKCFTIEGDADGEPMSKAAAEAALKQEFDLTVAVPASIPDERFNLMAVRRCLYGDGRAAHLMYRFGDEPVSLFVVPGLSRPAAEFSLFGHDQVVWTEGDRTYMLVARAGLGDGLARVASHLRNVAK